MISVGNGESPPAGFLIAGTLIIQSMTGRSRELPLIVVRRLGVHPLEDGDVLNRGWLILLPSCLYNARQRQKVSSPRLVAGVNLVAGPVQIQKPAPAGWEAAPGVEPRPARFRLPPAGDDAGSAQAASHGISGPREVPAGPGASAPSPSQSAGI